MKRPGPALQERGVESDTRGTWRLRSGARTMALSFPNQTRWYDATRRAVRFWGHDSAIETLFFVTEEALRRIQPDLHFD